MKHLSFINYLFVLLILASCNNNEGPDRAVFMQPSSIITTDAKGYNQTFEYDEYGRIVMWNMKSNMTDDPASYTAHYFYPDDNTITVKSEESWGKQKRCYEETIQLVRGRASYSEGTLITYINGKTELQKTYLLDFTYIPSNHLNIVKHSEVVGIGDDIKDNTWENAQTWENYLIWEDGNLKEFQDFQGHSSLYRTTKYEYSTYKVEYPVIIPMVINNAHHLPLFMQGVFGLNSVNLVDSSVIEENASLVLSHKYTYKIEQNRVTEFDETIFGNFGNPAISNPVSYKVNWTEK